MTLREKIVEIIDDADGADPLWMVDAADAILAAIKAHMTSPEAVERAGKAYEGYYTTAPIFDGRKCLEFSILAALGVEP